MFRHILVGVDGRGGGRDAIATARRLSEVGSEMTLGHVADHDTSIDAQRHPVWGDSHELLENARTAADLEAAIRHINARTAGLDCTAWPLASTPRFFSSARIAAGRSGR